MTTTRRLAAIMAADVAGFSAAMERDEEGTFARMQELRQTTIEPKIAEHLGRLVKTTGDGFLAEFASPIAAMRCALAIQSELANSNLQLRIGLNLGDVIVEDSGDVYGEGVNVAARLETLADPGGILISAKVHSEVEGKVEAAFDDRGEQQVKNIARLVRIYAVRIRSGTASNDARPLPLPDKPSIAVLPFQNMSGDPEQEYFADGVVEDIITALSRFKSLFVIARNSSFTYKGKAVDIKQVGRELGVRYVLEGSVRKAGGRLRITGQLIEAASNTHLWADKFEGPLDDVFDLQDRVTSSVVGVVAPKIEQVEIEKVRHKPTSSLEAYDFYLRGVAGHDQWTREANEEALHLLAKAIELDPQFTAAMARLCSCYTQRVFQRWIADPKREADEAVRLARRALETEKEDASVLAWGALTLAMFAGETEAAVPILERALQLNPNMMVVQLLSGAIRIWRGDLELAVEHYHNALRLNPYDMLGFSAQTGVAGAYLLLGQNDQALIWAERALASNPRIIITLRWGAAIYAAAGQIEKSRDLVARLLALNPEESISRVAVGLLKNEHRQTLVTALRAAGLPE